MSRQPNFYSCQKPETAGSGQNSYPNQALQHEDRTGNILLLGPPGVGKTHLAVALGIEAIHKGFVVSYCSIFDIASAIATNRPLEDWGKIFGDNATAAAILVRFLENVHFIKITGKSYRLKNIHTKEQKVIDSKEKS